MSVIVVAAVVNLYEEIFFLILFCTDGTVHVSDNGTAVEQPGEAGSGNVYITADTTKTHIPPLGNDGQLYVIIIFVFHPCFGKSSL